MKAVLSALSGPGAGSKVFIEEQVVITVGRNPTCTLSIPNDKFISGNHFELKLVDGHLLLRDLKSRNGTHFKGERIAEQMLRASDTFLAGETTFGVQIERESHGGDLVRFFSSQPEPVYVVLDAARDTAIFSLLLTIGGHFWNLYTGRSAVELETVAPYLVYLPPQSDLLRHIVEQGWGNSWGVFLTSGQPPPTIWHEMRRILMVKLESTQKFVYFRFYDPRVLRIFLPISNPEQRAQFATMGSSFVVESEDPGKLLMFRFLQGEYYASEVDL